MGFWAKCSAEMLSHYTLIGRETGTCRSSSKPWIQTSSLAEVDILLYSVSADDLLTLCCFLVFQETRLEPIKIA